METTCPTGQSRAPASSLNRKEDWGLSCPMGVDAAQGAPILVSGLPRQVRQRRGEVDHLLAGPTGNLQNEPGT
jgi:hypothetical protein